MTSTLSRSTTVNEAKAVKLMQTRILLALLTLEVATQSQLKSSLVRKREKETKVDHEKRTDLYRSAIADLEKSGAFSTQGKKIALSAMGHEFLEQGLLSPEFTFDAQIGAKTANALLQWMHQKTASSVVMTNGKQKADAISTYDEFKTVALKVFDRLNKDFNLDNLVPIYRIRREIGDQVERGQFDEWLLEMQSHDGWQLIGGEMPELTPDKAEDSIKTALGGVRYYAKRL